MTVTDRPTTFRSTGEPADGAHQIDEVLILAESLLGNVVLRRPTRHVGAAPGPEQVAALVRAERALALALDHSAEHRGTGPTDQHRTYLSVALTQVRMLRSAASTEIAAQRSLSAVRDAVAHLRPITTVAELLAQAPARAAELGYHRVLVSRLVSWLWLPHFAYATDGPEMAEGMVRVGSVRPRRLNGTLAEMDMVRDRSAMLVRDAQHQPRMHKELVSYTNTTSYVAAPLVSSGQVVGMLHADKTDTEVDDLDQDMLLLFAECLGFALERTVFSERLQALRTQLSGQANSINDLISQFIDDETVSLPDLPATGPVHPANTAAAGPAGERVDEARELLGLTRRESEILREMATGKTNSQIAERLYISQGTVKSHVKSVLRKLGAANRADAVSRYFHADPRLC